MKYICQLKESFMLAMIDKETFRVVKTGYPYPDTKKPSAEMLRDLLRYLKVDKSIADKFDLEKLWLLLRDHPLTLDISKDDLRSAIIGKRDDKVKSECYGSIFMRCKTVALYFIYNASASTNHYIRGLVERKGVVADDILCIVSVPNKWIEDSLKLVSREEAPGFKEFNRGIQIQNSLGLGVEFHETLFRYAPVSNMILSSYPHTFNLGMNLIRSQIDMLITYLIRCLGIEIVPKDILNCANEISIKLYGKIVFSSDQEFAHVLSPLRSYWFALWSKIFLMETDEDTHKKLEKLLRTCISACAYELHSTKGYIKDYDIIDDNVTLVCSDTIVCTCDLGKTSYNYKDYVNALLRLKGKSQVHLYKSANSKAAVSLGGTLGSNFTSYEKRLFQFFAMCGVMFDVDFPSSMDFSYKLIEDWVSRFMPFIYENFNRRFMMGAFSFKDLKALPYKCFNMGVSFFDMLGHPLFIPDLFKQLKLDNFNDRQLTDDEVLFLLVFILLFYARLYVEKGKDDKHIETYDLSIFCVGPYHPTEEDRDIKIESSIQPVLKEFIKMYMLAEACKLREDDGEPAGLFGVDPRFSLGGYLFVKKGIDRVTDEDFSISFDKDHIRAELVFRG